MTDDQPALTVTQIRELGADLVTQLAEHPGDADAVSATLLRWLDVLDTRDFTRVVSVALWTTFAECLTPHPDAIPADGYTIRPPEGVIA